MRVFGDLDLARECGVRVLQARIPSLVGKDHKGQIPKLQQRIHAIRGGLLDGAPEVQSVIEALTMIDRGQRLRPDLADD